jgi:transposase
MDWFCSCFLRIRNDGIIAGRYDTGFRERAVRLLADSLGNYTSGTKALEGVARDLGIAAGSLRRWRWQTDTANAVNPSESEELRRLHRENTGLRRSNEILSSPSAFHGAARLDTALTVAYVDVHRIRFGVGPICRTLRASLDCGLLTPRACWRAKARAGSRMRARHEALARVTSCRSACTGSWPCTATGRCSCG